MTDQTCTPFEKSLTSIFPAWPLQSSVAVNPFWFMKEDSLEDVFAEMEAALHSSLFMPTSYYQQKYRNGEISFANLQKAIQKGREKWPDMPVDTSLYEHHHHENANLLHTTLTLAEVIKQGDFDYHTAFVDDISKHAGAYLDDRQALVRYPWQNSSFLKGWIESQQYDRTMLTYGLVNFEKVALSFSEMTPTTIVNSIFAQMKITSSTGQKAYLQRLIATVMGWASQFKYWEWQKSLGYPSNEHAKVEEFIAVRLIYDFALFSHFSKTHPHKVQLWVDQCNEMVPSTLDLSLTHKMQWIWHSALEFSYQTRTAGKISLQYDQNQRKKTENSAESNTIREKRVENKIEVQMVFCIDVRSEMLRRHIETVNPNIQTIGFAGFFGVPIEVQRLDEKSPGARLPVLLSPAHKLEETPEDSGSKKKDRPRSWMIGSYFKNFRKASFSSFLYVEMFGILTLGSLLKRSFKSLIAKVNGHNPLDGLVDQNSTFIDKSIEGLSESESLAAKVERGKSVLTGMGLLDNFAPVVVICGHGAKTSNNALSSALDCGACGGHPGDVNARFIAGLLNETGVRRGLEEHNIQIPEETVFVPALHETVTDTVHLLEMKKIPAHLKKSVWKLQQNLAAASAKTTEERSSARSEVLDSNTVRRSTNWSEVRPEWGLAGNACFIIAPRSRSKHVNLSSRAFLHDYDYTKDSHFSLLELIMTAPMVVTNWINMQYLSSVVAPNYYGCGNKIIHNLSGETGVVEGNGGDLRVGLSWQSVHDGNEFIHEPLRLSVFIEAPRDAIENIISKHTSVKNLVDNNWLYLLRIDPQTGKITRREKGEYVDL